MVWGFILLLRLKNKNKVFKKSVNYFLALMKDAQYSFIFLSLAKLIFFLLLLFKNFFKKKSKKNETFYHKYFVDCLKTITLHYCYLVKYTNEIKLKDVAIQRLTLSEHFELTEKKNSIAMPAAVKTERPQIKLDSQRPFLGLNSYGEEHKNFYFGREQDIENILRIVRKKITCVVYGKSGIGKTSLIRAGIIPELRKKYLLPIYIRINYASAKSPMAQVRATILSAYQNIESSIPDFAELTVWEYLHVIQLLGGTVQPVLIFDQFEEIFTLGVKNSKKAKIFLNFISELANNSVPQRVVEKYQRSNTDFPNTFNRIEYRLVFSLREDFLPQFESLRIDNNPQQNEHYRVLKMNGEDALHSILMPGKEILNKDVARKIIERLPEAGEHDFGTPEKVTLWKYKKIDSFLLSFYCYALNEKRLEEKQLQITSEILQGLEVEEIMKAHYTKIIGNLRENVALAVENKLLTTEGYRKIEPLTDFQTAFEITDSEVQLLIDKKIISKHLRGSTIYIELIHDVLVPVIREIRDERIKRQKEAVEKEQNERIKFFAAAQQKKQEVEQRKKTARTHTSLTIISIAFIISVLMAIYAFHKKNEAKSELVHSEAVTQAAKALNYLDSDPTKSFRLAQEAWLSYKNDRFVNEVFFKSFYGTDAFYCIMAKYDNMIFCADYSPDGKRIAVGTAANNVLIFDALGNKIDSLIGHEGWVRAVCFSPDGKTLATTGSDKTIRLWNENGEQFFKFNAHNNRVVSLCFSPDGKKILSASWDNTVKLWDLQGNCLQTFTSLEHPFNHVAFSPDNKTFAAACADGSVRVFDTAGEEIALLRGHSGWVLSVEFSPDGKNLISAGSDRTIKIWNTQNFNNIKNLYLSSAIVKAHYSVDGQYIVVAKDDASVSILNLQGEELATLLRHETTVYDAVIAPDGQSVCSVGKDGMVLLWRIKPDKYKNISNVKDTLWAVDYSASGNEIVYGGQNGITQIYNISENKILQLNGNSTKVNDVEFVENDKFVISITENGNITKFDLNGNMISQKNIENVCLNTMAISEKEKIIFAGDSKGNIFVLNFELKVIHNFLAHNNLIQQICFAQNEKVFFSASTDGTIKKWDLRGNPLKTMIQNNVPIVALGLSPDNNLMVWATSENFHYLTDIENDITTEYNTHTNRISAIQFSNNGNQYFTTSLDRKCCLWQSNGELIFEFQVPEWIQDATISPAGNYIVGVGNKGMALLWAISPAEILKHVDILKSYGNVWNFDK